MMSRLLNLPSGILDQIIESLFTELNTWQPLQMKTLAAFTKCCHKTREALSRNHILWTIAMMHPRMDMRNIACEQNASSAMVSTSFQTCVTPKEKDLHRPELAKFSLMFAPNSYVFEINIVVKANRNDTMPIVHVRPNIGSSRKQRIDDEDVYTKFGIPKNSDTNDTALCLRCDFETNEILLCQKSCPFKDVQVSPLQFHIYLIGI